jgi:hypothetical protein
MILNKKGKRILIVTCQGLIHPEMPATGGSLRAYCLGEALKECGHRVIYSVPKACLTDSTRNFHGWMKYSHSVTDIDEIVSEVRPEIVIFSNWGLAEEAPECDVPVVVDFNGPLVLENFYRGKDAFLDDALTKIRAITKLDLILAGSEAQRNYLIAWCLMAGMNPEDFSIEIIPFSLSPVMPKRQPPDEPIFVLAGYDWPWLDGREPIMTVNRELEKLKRGHLHIYTCPPPYTNVVRGEDSWSDLTGDLELSQLSRVTRHDPVSFTELTEILCKSSVALDVWSRNLERELAFPSRTVTYLWAGLPVITSNFGELSNLIDRYAAGWTVDSRNGKYLAALVQKIVNAPQCLSDPGANAQRLVATHLTWDKTIEPLDRFCRAPKISRSSSPFTATLNRYQQKQHALQRDLNESFQTMKALKNRIADLQTECEIMGIEHRRRKGFAVLLSPSLVWLKMRRLVLGVPVLIYLIIITMIGQILHKIWLWRERI